MHTSAPRNILHLAVVLCSVASLLSIIYLTLRNTADLPRAADTVAPELKVESNVESRDIVPSGHGDSRVDVTSLGISRDFVYMFILDRSDLAFYKTQKIWDDLILITETPEECQGQERCHSLNESFEYATLPQKVFKTLILLNNTYNGWRSISKMDDDALVDIRSLRKVRTIWPHTYMGMISRNSAAKGFDITYATGHYYTMGWKVVQCVLEHEVEYFGLDSWAEDASLGWVISNNCEHELVNITSYDLIWHKNLNNNKNKVCDLQAPVP